MSARDPLTGFQSVILSALERGGLERDGDPRLVVAEIAGAAPDAAFADWVAAWDPDLTDLAGRLVAKWAARDDPAPPR